MKKVLLISIAVLFLATGAAHAGCHEFYFRCGNKLVLADGCTVWGFSEIISKEKAINLPRRAFRMRVYGDPASGLYFRGHRCSCVNALIPEMAQASDQCRDSK